MITVDQDGGFNRALKKVTKSLDDLRLPLSLIAREWFKSNVAIFSLAGYGKYEEYSPSYEDWKIKKFGKVSVLKVSGRLEKSITDPADKYAVNEITNKKILTLGTKVVSSKGAPYAVYLQNGTKFMSARPSVLFGNEQVAPSSLNKRLENWAKILSVYNLQKSKPIGKVRL